MTENHCCDKASNHKNIKSILVEDYDKPAFMGNREKV
jgi:hypothetical protein